MNILIIAAHPDDEVLGMGATIKKLTNQKNVVHLCLVSEGSSAQYLDSKMIKMRRSSCIKAGKYLGISKFYFLDFPDMRLDTIPHLEINKKIENIIKIFRPKVVYTTPNNDLNKDHQVVFESTLVAARPLITSVKQILSYEVPAIVRTPFIPNTYEEISKEIHHKIYAFKMYKSEIRKYPHPRSLESIESLAIQRGIESGLNRAESFQLIKSILD